MSILSSVIGFFTNGSKTSEKVLDIADKAIDTSQERSERDQQDLESARAMPLSTHGTAFDVFVDGTNRLQRPAWGVYLLGGVIGYWSFPEVTKDGFWASMIVLYFTFLFGGRAILKDIPSAIAMMRGK